MPCVDGSTRYRVVWEQFVIGTLSPTMPADPSPTVYNYLAHIFWLADQRHAAGYIPMQVVADAMLLTLSATSRMIVRMKYDGLIDHKPYTGVRLTLKGEQAVAHFLYPYGVAKAFLVAVMGFGWHEVHTEAVQIALGELNERVVQRMYRMAGQPTHDPHGYPITRPESGPVQLNGVPLATAAEGQPYRIDRVATFAPDRLNYLEALKLTPQTAFTVVSMQPFAGPIQLKLAQEYRIVGRELSQVLRVVPQPPGSL